MPDRQKLQAEISKAIKSIQKRREALNFLTEIKRQFDMNPQEKVNSETVVRCIREHLDYTSEGSRPADNPFFMQSIQELFGTNASRAVASMSRYDKPPLAKEEPVETNARRRRKVNIMED